MSISKLVASSKNDSTKKGFNFLISGLILSSITSIVISIIIYFNSSYIANRLLFEPRCINLIKWMSFSIPLASIHACICGYYLGIKKTNIPAISQLYEQFFRVLFTYLIIITLASYNYKITPLVAVIGSLVGEIASSTYCIIKLRILMHKTYKIRSIKKHFKKSTYDIIKLSFPLTLNKLMLSILQSIQSVLIPSMLIIYGCTSKEALSTYGITLGLVLPLIMFPSAIINSMSLLILPTVSEADSNNNELKIKITINKAISFSCLFGILCFGIFTRYGTEISIFLFHKNYGKYISILGAICPFSYITASIASTINGLGHTKITFLHNIIMSIIQIMAIIFLIPKYGINGYLFGLLISSAICTFSHYISLLRLITFKVNIRKIFIYPFLYIFLFIKSCDTLFIKILNIENVFTFILSIIITIILYTYVYINEVKIN